MTKETVKIAIADGNTVTDVTELSTSGQPVRIKAVTNGKYILAEGDKGLAPQNITVKRVGKDLHITLEGGEPDQPQLIIEGFYDTQGQLVGMAEDGNFHEYIAADAEQDHSAAFLIEGVPSPQVLGVETVSGMSGVSGLSGGVFGTGLSMLSAGLIGLAAVGLAGAAVAASNNDDDKKDDSAPTPPAPVVSVSGDNVGTDTGPLVNGGTTDDTTPTFSGEGTPGNTIIIKDGDKVIGETIIGEDGKWTFTPEPLGDGPHDIVFVERNRDGIEGPPSPGFEIIIDTQAPAQTVISSVQDDGSTPEAIVQNGKTNDSTPTLNGQAEPGSTVEIFANGEKVGTAPVGADGTWSFTPSALQDNTYSFTVVAVDAAGNRGLASDPFVLTIYTVVPPTPGQDGNAGIGQVINDDGDEIPAGSSTNDSTPTFTGSGQEPGTTVTLRDENGAVIGEAIVDPNGNWSVTPDAPLSEESHEIVMTITDPLGNVSLPSDPFVVVVDTTAPGTPGQDGNGGIDSVRNDAGDLIAADGSTNDTTPTITGSNQQPGDKVTIYNGTDVIGTAIVAGDGTWSISPTMALGENTYSFTMTVTDAANNVSLPSLPYVVTIDITAPGTPGDGTNPGIGQVVNDDGDLIADGGATNDTTPTFSGSGQTPGETITLYDGTEAIGSVVVADDGSWTITPDMPLSEAPHEITMTVKDPAGNESAHSDPFDITVDVTAPATPGEGGIGGFGVVNDNDPLAPLDISNGGFTNDNTPLFSGADQQPDDIIKLYRNGAVVGSAIVQADGTWSFTPSPALTDDTYSFTMTVTDQAGNESAASAPLVFTVDIVAPVKPGDDGTGGIDQVIDNVNPGGIEEDILSGDSTNDNTPTIKGSNQLPGATITIYNGTDIIGSALVDDVGNWEITPLTPLMDATYDLTMTVTDLAGNESVPSDPFVVIVDTVLPPAITIDSMGKDGGSSDTDFITNDGSAGRLIQGSLSATLATGDKVQVSLDGGATWVDALVNGTTWSFLDQSAHSGDWNVQARVVDLAGNLTTAAQDIVLDTTAPTAPTSLEFNGSVVTVNFDGTGLNVGDTMEVVVGTARFTVQLTQAQIDAGSVDVTTNANAAMTTTHAMLIDVAGNVSQQLMPVLESEDFESVPVGGIPGGRVQDFGAFTFNWGTAVPSSGTMGVVAAGTTVGGFIAPSRGIALAASSTDASPSITLNNGVEAGAISFLVGQVTRPITLNFYDASNTLVHSVALPVNPTGVVEVDFQLPGGTTFTRIEFDASDAADWLWIDDITFSTGAFDHIDPPASQHIDGIGGYYGDEAANIFSLDTTAFLNNASSVISGGEGNDTLSLTGTGQTLNLTTLTGHLESIEIINISGTGNNTLTLSLGDVLEQGQTSLFTGDDMVQMMVKGNTGDTVRLDDLLPGGSDPGDWAADGTTLVGGVTYNVFSHSTVDAQLLVQDGVTTTLV